MIQAKLTRTFYVRLVALAIFTLGIGTLVLLIVSRGYVETLDDEGVTSRGGKRLVWSDLTAVRPRYVRRPGGRAYLNDVTLTFGAGSVSVFPAVLDNGPEVLEWLRRRTGQPIPVQT
jgi:hypothetical protein